MQRNQCASRFHPTFRRILRAVLGVLLVVAVPSVEAAPVQNPVGDFADLIARQPAFESDVRIEMLGGTTTHTLDEHVARRADCTYIAPLSGTQSMGDARGEQERYRPFVLCASRESFTRFIEIDHDTRSYNTNVNAPPPGQTSGFPTVMWLFLTHRWLQPGELEAFSRPKDGLPPRTLRLVASRVPVGKYSCNKYGWSSADGREYLYCYVAPELSDLIVRYEWREGGGPNGEMMNLRFAYGTYTLLNPSLSVPEDRFSAPAGYRLVNRWEKLREPAGDVPFFPIP